MFCTNFISNPSPSCLYSNTEGVVFFGEKILVLIVTNPSIGGPGGEEVTWPPGAVNDRVGAWGPQSEFGLSV